MRGLVLSSLFVLIPAACFFASRSSPTVNDLQEARRVSIISLIASPRQYTGTRIYVTGYLNLSYESDAVYFHEDDFRYGMTKNAIRLVLKKSQREQFRAFSRNYVIIEGTFTADESASGMFSGYIVDVTRIQNLETEQEFMRHKTSSRARPAVGSLKLVAQEVGQVGEFPNTRGHVPPNGIKIKQVGNIKGAKQFGPARRDGLHNVPKTWVTLLGRRDFRAVQALASADRSIPDHTP